jgi:hypothetical protein
VRRSFSPPLVAPFADGHPTKGGTPTKSFVVPTLPGKVSKKEILNGGMKGREKDL